MTKINEIIRILMERDGLTKRDATNQLNMCRREIYKNLEDHIVIEDLMMEMLGLEPDYFFDII